ncbi:MAG: type I methionyl aminopeptidase, partial [Parcubacteria group bacterium CG10_big_fil_rev_8_21_14_0_10_35_15]
MISIKTSEEIKIMAEAGQILAGIMKKLEKEVKPGIKTMELETLAERLILESGNTCSFKGYDGFPSCLCVSINEQVIHGIPSDRILK